MQASVVAVRNRLRHGDRHPAGNRRKKIRRGFPSGPNPPVSISRVVWRERFVKVGQPATGHAAPLRGRSKNPCRSRTCPRPNAWIGDRSGFDNYPTIESCSRTAARCRPLSGRAPLADRPACASSPRVRSKDRSSASYLVAAPLRRLFSRSVRLPKGPQLPCPIRPRF